MASKKSQYWLNVNSHDYPLGRAELLVPVKKDERQKGKRSTSQSSSKELEQSENQK